MCDGECVTREQDREDERRKKIVEKDGLEKKIERKREREVGGGGLSIICKEMPLQHLAVRSDSKR